ncbi:MAG: DUF1223 domain-containing protein [Sulfitobacter sp.]
MHRLIKACAALWLSALPLSAENAPVVVELFTSQGCSSCPPADKLLHELADRSDVIALALHVDYWDYIGWQDEFAEPANADRQRAYANLAGRRSIYTPEMVINGQTDIVGARPMQLSKAIAEHKARPSTVKLMVERQGDDITIKAMALRPADGPMTVRMLRYTPLSETRITRGENSGHTYHYANVTRDWQELAQWDGTSTLKLTANAPGDAPVVVLIQSAGPGAIQAAAQIK